MRVNVWIAVAFIARIYLRILSFSKKFLHSNLIEILEGTFCDWLDSKTMETSQEIISKDGIFKFKPFELRKLDYRRAHEGSFPRQRSGHRLVCSENCLYLFGGYNPNHLSAEDPMTCLFKELWKFDLVAQQWTLLAGGDKFTLPLELASHAMLLHGSYLMIHGGTSFPFGMSMSNKLFIFRVKPEPVKLEEVVASGECPPTGYGQSIVIHQNYLYTVGGTDGFGYTSDVHRLNLQTRIWEFVYQSRTDIREDPEPRYRHELAYDGRFMYVIGGGTAERAYSMQRIPAFDLENNVWQYFDTKPDPKMLANGFPVNRKCHSCVQYKSFVMVVGGNDGHRSFRDIWRLDLTTFQWTCFVNQSSNFLYPLFFHDAAVTDDGCMYIFGGIKMRNNTPRRTNMIHEMWIEIPKLSVISWEALLSYFPHLRKSKRDDLLKLGVPRSFAARVDAA